MHISGNWNAKVDIEGTKVNIGNAKVDIEDTKVDIQNKLKGCADKTIGHTILFFVEYGKEKYFGRSDVERIIHRDGSFVIFY